MRGFRGRDELRMRKFVEVGACTRGEGIEGMVELPQKHKLRGEES